MIAMQLPRDQQVQQTHELQQAVQALEEDGEFYHNYSIADAHPLAPQANGHCQRGTMVHSHSNASMASMTHGQNFSHMYKPPNVIHVRVDPEDDKGIEVSNCQITLIEQSLKCMCIGLFGWTLWNFFYTYISS